MLAVLLLAGCVSVPHHVPWPTTQLAHPPRHVFLIVLADQSYRTAFSVHSPAPYLARTLPSQGALLGRYFAIGHWSLPNYIAMISGQGPNWATQADCPIFSAFTRSTPGLDANGQIRGEGCVYPPDVKTLGNQLQDAGYTWKGYMQDMGADPTREARSCAHPAIGAGDATNQPTTTDQYADKHDPFIYFRAIIDDHANCAAHVVDLNQLPRDLAHIATTPNFAFIVPGLCDDGHDKPCRNGQPGGLTVADTFLRHWIPLITASPAFKRDGVLIITFDQAPFTAGNRADVAACCNETYPAGAPVPGLQGPGGGLVGAVLLSPFILPGTVSNVPYNHYSLLRSIEDWFGLPHLGYAGQAGLRPFGNDIFNNEPPARKAKP